jgi:AbrB family looped-hinge helix DNA binding protein
MTHRVGRKAQAVIPKQMRDEVGIEPGDEISCWRDGDHVSLAPSDSVHRFAVASGVRPSPTNSP